MRYLKVWFIIINFSSAKSSRNYNNGGYSQWTPYSGCSAVCEGELGIRVRRRFCNSPRPSVKGKSCLEQGLGSSTEVIDCVGRIPRQSIDRNKECYIRE